MGREWAGADEYLHNALERQEKCEEIALHARRQGLNVTWEKVNKNYNTFRRWREGRIPTGYLIKQTGVRRVTDDPDSL